LAQWRGEEIVEEGKCEIVRMTLPVSILVVNGSGGAGVMFLLRNKKICWIDVSFHVN